MQLINIQELRDYFMKTMNMIVEQALYWTTVKPWHSMTLLSAHESLETETAVKKQWHCIRVQLYLYNLD
jgi:hypothetical protein